MGFLRMFFGALKQAKEDGKRYAKYKSMSKDELLSLSDQELFEAVEHILGLDIEEVKDANNCQKIFMSVDLFYNEVNNGGLCQFFVNSSREYAPFLSNALEQVGALKMKKLFDSFISENKINVNDLSSFICDDIDEYEAQTERYDFDKFDDAFYELGEIENQAELLAKYARENIEHLINK